MTKAQYVNPLSVLVGGVAIALILFYILYILHAHADAGEARSQFDMDATQHVGAIRMSIKLHQRNLYALRAFFQASREVTREEFHVFTRTLQQMTPAMQALEWVPKVTEAERKEYEYEASSSIPEFRFKELNQYGKLVTASSRDFYYPIYFIEPSAGNEVAYGFDLASESVHRTAMNQARDSGQMTIGGYVSLIQEKEEQKALHMFLPIYRQGASITNLVERRQHLKGFVLAVSRIDEIFDHAIAQLAIPGVDVWIVDTTDELQPSLLYAYSSGPHGVAPSDDLRVEQTIELEGRKWKVIAAPDPSSAMRFQPVSYLAWRMLFGGFLITAFIAWYLSRLRRYSVRLLESNRTMEHLIADLRRHEVKFKGGERKLSRALETAEIERSRLEDAIESIDACIAIYDIDERLIICNKKYRDTYHEVADRIVPGAVYKELLESYFRAAGLESLTEKTIDEWVDEWLKNYRHRKRNQIQKLHDRWISINDYPTSEGGVVSLGYDITAIKQAEEKIRSLNRIHTVISRTSSSLARSIDEGALLIAFCNNVVEIGGYSFSWIGYAQQDRSIHLVAKAGDMDVKMAVSALNAPDSDCFQRSTTEIAVNTGKTIVMRNLKEKFNDCAWKDVIVRYGYESMIVLPVKIGNEVRGNFSILSTDRKAFRKKEVALLEELAKILSLGIGTMRARVEREQKMRLFKNEIEQDERKRIAATLHDGVAQTMQAVNLRLKGMQTLMADEQHAATGLLSEVIGNIESVIGDLRNISHDLRPIFLEHMGLEEAVRYHCREMSTYGKVSIRVSNDNEPVMLDEITKEESFLSFREAMNNAIRHAEATRIDVIIEVVADDLLSIQISDDGTGFNTDVRLHLPSGLGLSMISERMQGIGGHAEIQSSLGKGTIVTLVIPTNVIARDPVVP